MALKVDSKSIIGWLGENETIFTEMSDQIWAKPETNWGEFFASGLQIDYLEKEGFKITRNPSDMKTAFIAEWGEGKPILAYIGEYDALPGLSQKTVPYREPVEEGAAGQGCGHNILGTAGVAAAVALQKWMQENKIAGTIRYYGCPAEEIGGGKVYYPVL